MTKLNIPKIKKVEPLNNLILIITFSNGKSKKYDCHILIKKNQNFQKLNNPGFFKNVHIDSGGYGLSWDDELDVSENELWNESL